MLGKSKCRILKEIRQKIADENDIPYVTRECTYQGECSGTCPRCESELRYLERELAARQALGKRVTVAALCAVTAIGAAGCTPQPEPTAGKPAVEPDSTAVTELDGNIALPGEEILDGVEVEGELVAPEDLELMGEPMPDPGQSYELEGDVACVPEAETENG